MRDTSQKLLEITWDVASLGAIVLGIIGVK
jgi:hypothetical protein